MKKLVLWITLSLISQITFAQTLQEGITLLENESISAARRVFRSLINKGPNADANYFLAECYYLDEEKQDSAIYFYNQALKIDDVAPLAHVGQGKMLLDKKQPLDAQKSFGRAVRYAKKSPGEAYAQIGLAYLHSQYPNVDEAIKNLTLSRDSDNKNARFFMLLGDAQMVKDQVGDALSNYEFAVSRDKNNPEILMKIARTYIKSGIPDVAQEKLEQLVAAFPNYAPAYKDLYEIYFTKKQYSKGLPLLDKYVSLVKDDVEQRARLVRFLAYQAKDYDRAIAEANIVLQQDPNNYTMYRWLAWAQFEKGNFKESLENSKKFFAAVGTRRTFTSDYEYYAKAAAKLGDTDIAGTNFKKVLELDSTRIDIYDLMGKMYYDAKKYEPASQAYQLKIEKGKPVSTDYYYMANSLYQIKKYVEADSAFVKVTTLNPTFATGWLMRARINKALDEAGPEDSTYPAAPFYQKVIELGEADTSGKFNKKSLVESYNYVAASNVYKKPEPDYKTALALFEKIVVIEPDNIDAKGNIEQLKPFVKN
jgi:tetratricopeptide (TPR) repeat protein